MPGTWGSLAALPCGCAIRAEYGGIGLAVAAGIVLAVGCWAAEKVVRASAIQDPGTIVIDEVVGQWLVLSTVPCDLPSYLLAFLLFRLFDIWKPWPVRWADQNVRGGLGIMLDDLLAGGYAALVLLVMLAIAGVVGVRR